MPGLIESYTHMKMTPELQGLINSVKKRVEGMSQEGEVASNLTFLIQRMEDEPEIIADGYEPVVYHTPPNVWQLIHPEYWTRVDKFLSDNGF